MRRPGFLVLRLFTVVLFFSLASKAPAATSLETTRDAVVKTILDILRTQPPALVTNSDQDLAVKHKDVENKLAAFLALLKTLPTEYDLIDSMKLDVLGEELKKAQPAHNTLRQVYLALRKAKEELEPKFYTPLRTAVLDYERALYVSKDKQAPAVYKEKLEALREGLSALSVADAGSLEQQSALRQIRTVYFWLRSAGQAVEICDGIQSHLASPNVRVLVFKSFIDDLLGGMQIEEIGRKIDELEIIKGNGIFTWGTMNFYGDVSVTLLEDPNKGSIQLNVNGHGDAKVQNNLGVNTGRKWVNGQWIYYYKPGIGNVFSTFNCLVNGGQLVTVDDIDFKAGKKERNINVSANANVTGARIDHWCRLIQRFGKKLAIREANKEKGDGEERAKTRVRSDIAAQIDEAVAKAQKKLQAATEELLFKTFDSKDLVPKLNWSSTTERLQMATILGTDCHLGTLCLPEQRLANPAHVVFQLHDSALENIEALLADEVVSEEEFIETFFDTLDMRIPNKDDVYFDVFPAKLHFVDSDSLALKVKKDNKATVTLNLKAFEANDELYDSRAMTVQANYSLSLLHPEGEDTRIEFTRIGEVSIQPTQKADNDEDIEALKPVMERFFPQKMWRAHGFQLNLMLEKAGTLTPTELMTNDEGWITIGYQHQKPEGSGAATTPEN